MPMRLFVGADGRLRDVRRDNVVAELELDIGRAGSFFRPVVELELFDIGDKARVPYAPVRQGRSFAAEVVLLSMEAIEKSIRIIKNEIVAVIDVKDGWRVGVPEIAHRLVSLSIEMLMPGIERNREHRP